MKNFIFTLLFLTSIVSAQKTGLFLDQNNKSISKNKFQKFNNYKEFIKSETITDSATVFKIEKRTAIGKLTSQELDKVILALGTESGKTIVIDYFPKKDECNSSGNEIIRQQNWQSYLEKIKKFESANQFFVSATDDAKTYFPSAAKIVRDDGTFKSLFFPSHYPCGSFAVIQPNGEYYVYKGEYQNSKIFDFLNSRK